jgi:ABC-2 type transport system ATP-binding protein
MRQRLGVARALLDDPELRVLDEPSNGLDAGGMVSFRALIRSLVDDEGKTVFISSHLLDEVEKICDRVAIVDHGRVVVEGALVELLAAGGGGVEVDCDQPDRAREVLGDQPGVTGVETRNDGTLLVHAAGGRTTAVTLNRALVGAGIGVAGLRQSASSLEERFLAITAGSTPSSPGPVPDAEPPAAGKGPA